ncbi:MAG: rod shape-determining protein MreC [Patescibacteria group bacterium]
MNWFRQNKWGVILLLGITAFGLVMQSGGNAGAFLRGGARSLGANVWEVAHHARTYIDERAGFASRRSLAAENLALRKELERTQFLSLTNDVLRGENATLRELVGLAKDYPLGVAAPVLSSPSVSPYGTFVVGAGEKDGVAVGSVVVVAPRVAIGKVVEVHYGHSLVELFSAPGKTVEVIVKDVKTTYTGRGDGNGLIEAPRGVSVEVGDAVHLPGTPLAIGVVGFIKRDPQDPLALILARTPMSIPTLSFVEIIPPFGE